MYTTLNGQLTTDDKPVLVIPALPSHTLRAFDYSSAAICKCSLLRRVYGIC